MKPFIITGLDYKGLTKEQIHYYNCFFGKRSIDEMNKFIEKIGVKDKKNQSMSKLIFNLSLNKNYIELALSISLV